MAIRYRFNDSNCEARERETERDDRAKEEEKHVQDSAMIPFCIAAMMYWLTIDANIH